MGAYGPELRAPEYELDMGRSLHSGRQVPVYPSTGKLSQKLLRLWASQVVDSCAALVGEFLPRRILESAGIIAIEEALRWIHFPASPEDAARAVRRLAFDELFLLQLGVLERRRDWREGSPGKAISVQREEVREFARSLEFELTADQKRAVADILDDIECPVAMNRLLQGDVGSRQDGRGRLRGTRRGAGRSADGVHGPNSNPGRATFPDADRPARAVRLRRGSDNRGDFEGAAPQEVEKC